MQMVLRFFPGLVGAAIALTVLKLVSWTDLEFEVRLPVAQFSDPEYCQSRRSECNEQTESGICVG